MSGADIEQQFIALSSPSSSRNGSGAYPCEGLYMRPAGAAPEVAFIATHYNQNYMNHYLSDLIAARGFGFLGWNTRFRGLESHFLLDQALSDIGAGVRWLKDVAGVKKVVLLGNSGGGSLMAAYQSQARFPNLAPQGVFPVAGIDELPAGDFFISVASHPGRPEVLTAWLDPSVTDETDPLSRDPDLDIYNPANGPPFGSDFLERYRAAQIARNHRITAWVKSELDRFRAHDAFDRVFAVQRTWADPRFIDGALDPSDRQVPACYLGTNPKFANYSGMGIGMASSLRTWLSMWSLEDSPCRAGPHLAKIDIPSLIVHPMGDEGIYPSDAKAMYERLAAEDKTLTFLPGNHYFLEPAGARAALAGTIVEWLTVRLDLKIA